MNPSQAFYLKASIQTSVSQVFQVEAKKTATESVSARISRLLQDRSTIKPKVKEKKDSEPAHK